MAPSNFLTDLLTANLEFDTIWRQKLNDPNEEPYLAMIKVRFDNLFLFFHLSHSHLKITNMYLLVEWNSLHNEPSEFFLKRSSTYKLLLLLLLVLNTYLL